MIAKKDEDGLVKEYRIAVKGHIKLWSNYEPDAIRHKDFVLKELNELGHLGWGNISAETFEVKDLVLTQIDIEKTGREEEQ